MTAKVSQASSKFTSSAQQVGIAQNVVLPQGEFQLPNRVEMEADVARKQAWRRSLMPEHNIRAGRLGPLTLHLFDELVTDMGYSRFRKVCVTLVDFLAKGMESA